MSLRKDAFSGVRWTGSATVIIALLQVFQLAVLARFLDANDFGLMAIVMVVVGFSQVFSDMGMSNAVIAYQENGDQELSSLYWFNIMAGWVVAVIVVCLAPLISHIYAEPELFDLLVLMAMTFFIQPLGQQFRFLLERDFKFGTLAGIDVSAKAAGFVLSVVLAVRGWGVYSLVWGTLLNTTTMTIFLVCFGIRVHRPRLHFRWHDLEKFWRFGLYQMGERSLNYLAVNLDKILIGKFFGMELLGFYNLAYQLVIKPFSIINPVVNRVAFPVYSSIQKDLARINSLYCKSSQAITFVCFPVYWGMFAVSDEIVQLLYGVDWGQTVEIFNVIWLLGLIWSIGNPIGSYLLSQGKANVGFYMAACQVVVSFLCLSSGCFVPFQTMIWILVLGMYVIMLPLDYWVRYRVSGMSVIAHVRSYAKNLGISAVMCAGVMAIKSWDSFDLLAGFVVHVLCGIAIYAILTFIFNRLMINEYIEAR